MRLFEAIIEANHRALAGDKSAGLRASEYAEALPVVALTCVDPRLNPLIPEVLGIREEDFIWLRNAGNIITSSTSSTMRSLALACAIKGGKEIVVIGHTDCRVGQTSTLDLIEHFKALGLDRAQLPENLTEFFGVFASERQNVLKGVEFIRHSPLIGPRIPVHGLLVDTQSGRLEWLVDGYRASETVAARFAQALQAGQAAPSTSPELPQFNLGEMKFPETKIGEMAAPVSEWLKEVRVTEPPHEEPPKKLKVEKGKPVPPPPPPPLIVRPRPRPRPKAWWE